MTSGEALAYSIENTIGGLSGVVLANASLDIAFHDTLYFYNSSLSSYLSSLW